MNFRTRPYHNTPNEIYVHALKLLRARDCTVLKLREKLEAKFGSAPQEVIDRYGERGPVGTVEQAVERLKEIEEIGYERVMLQHLAHQDLETVALIGRELAPAVA